MCNVYCKDDACVVRRPAGFPRVVAALSRAPQTRSVFLSFSSPPHLTSLSYRNFKLAFLRDDLYTLYSRHFPSVLLEVQ